MMWCCSGSALLPSGQATIDVGIIMSGRLQRTGKSCRDLTKIRSEHNNVLQIAGKVSKMECECVTCNETMAVENARCIHPGDYCKYRSSCIIHFMSKEKEDVTPSVQSNQDDFKTD